MKSVHNALRNVCGHDSVKKDLIHENKINLILINRGHFERAHFIPKRTCSSLSGNQYKQGVVFVFLNRLSSKLPAFFWSSSSSSTSAAGFSSTTLEKRHKNTTLFKRIVASFYHPPHDPVRLHNQLVCYTAVFASSLCRLRSEERCVTTQRTAVQQTTEPAAVQKMSGRLRFPLKRDRNRGSRRKRAYKPICLAGFSHRKNTYKDVRLRSRSSFSEEQTKNTWMTNSNLSFMKQCQNNIQGKVDVSAGDKNTLHHRFSRRTS